MEVLRQQILTMLQVLLQRSVIMLLQRSLTQVLYYSMQRDAKSVTGTIAEAAGGDTTEIKVINSANGEAPSVVTFTGTVAADTLTVGTQLVRRCCVI